MAIGLELVVFPIFEVNVLKINITQSMCTRAQIDYSTKAGNQSRVQTPCQNKVTKVIGRKLHFPALAGPGKRTCHHPGIVNEEVKLLMILKPFVCTLSNRFRDREIQFRHIKLGTRLGSR